MLISKKINNLTTLRALSSVEVGLAQKMLQTNLGLKPGESVLIITDPAMLDMEAALWFEGAKSLNAPTELIVIEGLVTSGQHPTPEVIKECTRDGIVLFQTSYSLTHTAAAKAACSRGARVASLPSVNYAVIQKTLNVDFNPIRSVGTQLVEILNTGSRIVLTSSAGTNLSAAIRPGHIIDDNGFIAPGDVGNLPAGEVFFCPLEGSTNGTWVVNGSMADEEALDQPIKITIKDGFATAIEGGMAAQRLQSKLETVGPHAFEVAEIGIGTNPAASPLASLIEAEKAAGSAHLALGNSVGFGGSNTAPIHLDGVTIQPTITVDDQLVLANNKFSFTLKKD